MEYILIIWVIIMFIYLMIERRIIKKWSYESYVKQVKRMNRISENEYRKGGVLSKYKPFNIKPFSKFN